MKKILIVFATIVLMASILSISVYADPPSSSSQSVTNTTGSSLEDSKIVTGTKALISDAQAILIGLSILIGGGFITYYFIRKGMADEHDQVQWKKRIIGAGICTVGAVVASTVLPILVGYYQ